MRRLIARLALNLIALGLASASFAQTQNSYDAHCAQCHKGNGSGDIHLSAPNLTHLSESYMNRQVVAFGNGSRVGLSTSSSGGIMAAAIAHLDEATLTAAVREAAALPALTTGSAMTPEAKSVEPQLNLRSGRDHYTAYCSSCHGTRGTGNDALGAPALIGLERDYLLRQYTAFAEGRRGGKGAGRYAQQMGRLAKALPGGDQMSNVMAYVQTLTP